MLTPGPVVYGLLKSSVRRGNRLEQLAPLSLALLFFPASLAPKPQNWQRDSKMHLGDSVRGGS